MKALKAVATVLIIIAVILVIGWLRYQDRPQCTTWDPTPVTAGTVYDCNRNPPK